MSNRFSSRKLVLSREASGLSVPDLAGRLGVDVETVRHWEVGSAVPSPRSLCRLAEALRVSVAELHNDDPSPLLLKDLRRRAGLTQAELGLTLSTSATMVSNWERGKVHFPPDQLVTLAEGLGVRVEAASEAVRATHRYFNTGHDVDTDMTPASFGTAAFSEEQLWRLLDALEDLGDTLEGPIDEWLRADQHRIDALLEGRFDELVDLAVNYPNRQGQRDVGDSAFTGIAEDIDMPIIRSGHRDIRVVEPDNER